MDRTYENIILQNIKNDDPSAIGINKADFEIYTSWKDRRYEFKNESLGKIFRIMKRSWDVKIEYPESKLNNERISGELRRY